MKPTKLQLEDGKNLKIDWDNGRSSIITLRDLRKQCPCATCRAEVESHGPSWIPLYSRDALAIEGIEPLGHYALRFNWKDGHNTGIYSYEYLVQIAPPQD
jgi:DUF971 family protein